MRITVSLIRCGACGRQYNPFRAHLCPTGRSRRRRTSVSPRVRVTCSKCHKPLGNPLTHVCTTRSDWARRVARAERERKAAAQRDKRRKTAERRRERRRETAARKRARQRQRKKEAAERRKAAERQRQQARREAAKRGSSHDSDRHDPQACADIDCPRFPCRVYREGREAGHAEGLAEGYANGYADGIGACPYPHL